MPPVHRRPRARPPARPPTCPPAHGIEGRAHHDENHWSTRANEGARAGHPPGTITSLDSKHCELQRPIKSLNPGKTLTPLQKPSQCPTHKHPSQLPRPWPAGGLFRLRAVHRRWNLPRVVASASVPNCGRILQTGPLGCAGCRRHRRHRLFGLPCSASSRVHTPLDPL